MPYLGDFLGLLAQEITLARLHADTEAVRVAEFYAADPLLRYFPVPRFRLPTVNLRVAVAVEGMDDSMGKPALDLTKVKPVFYELFDRQQLETGQELPDETRQRVDEAVGSALSALENDLRLGRSVRTITSNVTDAAFAVIAHDRPWSTRQLDIQKANFAAALEGALVAIRNPPPRMTVAVTAEQLAAAGDNLLHLDLVLGEDAVEWTVVDSDDPASSRLVPE